MQMSANTADSGNVQDGDGQVPLHLKVHFRCVKNQQQLTSLLDRVSGQGYAIEMRHNMYLIRTKAPLTQKKLVSEAH